LLAVWGIMLSAAHREARAAAAAPVAEPDDNFEFDEGAQTQRLRKLARTA
jgi:cbb3-type cytochrome oxidase subunit 3